MTRRVEPSRATVTPMGRAHRAPIARCQPIQAFERFGGIVYRHL